MPVRNPTVGASELLFNLLFSLFIPNQINATIPAGEPTRALNLLKQAHEILVPYLHALTPDERKNIVKMGDKSIGFMTKLLDYTTNTPSFVPAFIDFDALKQDVGVANDPTPLDQFAAQFALNLDSTVMVASSKGMSQASPVYKNIRFLAEQKPPGAQVLAGHASPKKSAAQPFFSSERLKTRSELFFGLSAPLKTRSERVSASHVPLQCHPWPLPGGACEPRGGRRAARLTPPSACGRPARRRPAPLLGRGPACGPGAAPRRCRRFSAGSRAAQIRLCPGHR